MLKVVKLKNISTLIGSGVTPLRSNPLNWENGTISWLKTEQLGEAKIYDTTEKISQYAIEETGIKIFPINTISVAMYGEGRTRGNVSILKQEMTTNQACCNIVIDEEKADYEYVFYYLKTQYNQLRNLSSGVRKNLNSNDIKEFEIRLPKDLTTQRQIASVLSSLDAKIELNNKINAELEAMAKTIYDYWFVQFDFPNAEGKPYKTSGGKMVYDEELKREIPEGWEVELMEDWIDLNKSGDWGKEEEIGNYNTKVNCIRGADINGVNGLEECNSPERFILEKNAFKILKDGDFVVEISGGSPTQSTGRIALITDAVLKRLSNPVICSNFCKPISMKDKKHSFYFLKHWMRLYNNNIFFGFEGKTSGIKNLLFESLVSSNYIIKPPENILDRFNAIVFANHKKQQQNLLKNQQLTQLRDWLLPMLMNGQVTVGAAQEVLGMVAEDGEKYQKSKN